jgi:hypothetical protein
MKNPPMVRIRSAAEKRKSKNYFDEGVKKG